MGRWVYIAFIHLFVMWLWLCLLSVSVVACRGVFIGRRQTDRQTTEASNRPRPHLSVPSFTRLHVANTHGCLREWMVMDRMSLTLPLSLPSPG
mmetsp:Transcript_19723/g.47814  ORF Transcript_19723/g.47814 Transcript_19723/m.47814 type:complete len:93 (+) Transcript_19723:313-591(+)